MKNIYRLSTSRFAAASFMGAIFAFATGCSTSPGDDAGKQVLTSKSDALMTRFKASDPTLQEVINSSAGYAIFPSIGKGGIGIGGAYGRGEVYEKGMKVGYADMTQASIGFQFGGQEYAELLVFKTTEKLTAFKTGNFAFTADASAVAATAGAAAASKFQGGIGVFTISEAGLMYQATLGGQRFSYQPLQ